MLMTETNTYILVIICAVLVLINFVQFTNTLYLKKYINTELNRYDFNINDLIRKLSEANAEIDSLRKKEKCMSLNSFLFNYSKLLEYLTSFNIKHDGYYGKTKYGNIDEYCYIIDIFDSKEVLMFEVVLPDVTKTNPEGLLTCFDVTEDKIVGKEGGYKNISKLINKKFLIKN